MLSTAFFWCVPGKCWSFEIKITAMKKSWTSNIPIARAAWLAIIAYPRGCMPRVASPNNIYYSEKLRNHFWSGSAIPNHGLLRTRNILSLIECGTVVRTLQTLVSTIKISANSLTTHIKLKRFRSFFQFRTFLLKKCLRAFSCFSWFHSWYPGGGGCVLT